jgi:ribosome-binding factor A
MSVIREKRINAEILRNLSEILSRLKNPSITAMVSVMRVDTTNDLKHSKVWLSLYGTQSQCDETFKAIEHASIMKDMRTMPELHFLKDDSQEYSQKINKIISEINTGKDDDKS